MAEKPKPVDVKPEQSKEEEISIDAPVKRAGSPASVEPKKDEAIQESSSASELLQQLIHMNEDDFLMWEEVTLPSEGYYYDDKLPGGVVRVRAMGLHAEKILATQRLAQTGQSIDYLFNHCVQLTEGFDQSELLAGDRIFLLYYLRGITYGNNYEFVSACPNCEARSIHSYDLNELASTIRGPNHAVGDEPFKVILPYMSERMGREVWVKVRFVRGKDISNMAGRQRFNRKVHSAKAHNQRAKPQQQTSRQVTIDQTITDNLALVVEAFGGEGLKDEVRDKPRLRGLFDSDKVHARDTAAIREFLRENSPGIDTMIQMQCPECGNEMTTELPITESFFRPTSEGESK